MRCTRRAQAGLGLRVYNTILLSVFRRDLLDCDDGSRLTFVLGDHLGQNRPGRVHQIIGQDHGKGLVSDQVPSTQHRVPEAERFGLPNGTVARSRAISSNRAQQSAVALRLQACLELSDVIEVVLDGSLRAVGHEDNVLDACRHGLLHRVFDDRLVHYRQHFLRQHLRRRKEAANPGRRQEIRLYG